MKRFLSGLVLLITVNLNSNGHPVHVSVCNLELSRSGSILSVKLYSDDFGTVIQNNFNDSLILEKADEIPYREYILNYISSNFQLFVDNKKSGNFVYDYSEFNQESIWLYFKIRKVKKSGNVRIINTLMLDLFDDQTNLLIITLEGKQNGFRFNQFTTELNVKLE